MIATLDRFADDEIPVPEGSSVAELRAFYAEWRSRRTPLPHYFSQLGDLARVGSVVVSFGSQRVTGRPGRACRIPP
jgi:hypothetical protein